MACQSNCQNVPILEHLSLGVMDAYVPGITASSFKGRNCFSSIFPSLASSIMSEPQYLTSEVNQFKSFLPSFSAFWAKIRAPRIQEQGTQAGQAWKKVKRQSQKGGNMES